MNLLIIVGIALLVISLINLSILLSTAIDDYDYYNTLSESERQVVGVYLMITIPFIIIFIALPLVVGIGLLAFGFSPLYAKDKNQIEQ